MEIRNRKNQRPIDVTTNKYIINILFQYISGKEFAATDSNTKPLFRINLTKRSRVRLLIPESNKVLNTTNITSPIVIIRINLRRDTIHQEHLSYINSIPIMKIKLASHLLHL